MEFKFCFTKDGLTSVFKVFFINRPPLIKSSTYTLFPYFCNFYWIYLLLQHSTNKNGDDDKSNKALVNLKVSTIMVIKTLGQ